MPKVTTTDEQLWFHTPRSVVKVSVIAGLLLLVISGWLWWQQVYLSPRRIFWDAIATRLATPSLIRHTTQLSQGSGLNQYSAIQLGHQTNVHAVTEVTQEENDGSQSRVSTENLATPTINYIRYTGITSTQKNAAGQPINFKPLVNLWAKGNVYINDPDSTVNQELFGIVPVANINGDQRRTIVSLMQSSKVYSTNYSSVGKEKVDGRTASIYHVKVNPSAYVAMLQQLARVTGLVAAQNFAASDYSSQADINLDFVIDPLSHELLQIRYPAVNRTDTFSGNGILHPVTFPSHTMPTSELQARLQSLQ